MPSSILIFFLVTSSLTIHLRDATVIPSLLSHAQVLDNSCQCDCCYTISDSRTECVPPTDAFFETSSCSLCTVAECQSRFPAPCSQTSSVVHAKCIPQQGVFFRVVPAILVLATLALLVYGFFFKKFDGYHREISETPINTERTTQYNTFENPPSSPDHDDDRKTPTRHPRNLTAFPTFPQDQVRPPEQAAPTPPGLDLLQPPSPVETTDTQQPDEIQPLMLTDEMDIDAKVSEAATLGSDSTTARDIAVFSEIPITETPYDHDHHTQSADVPHVTEHETAAIFEAPVPDVAQINVAEPNSALSEPLSSTLVQLGEPEVAPSGQGDFDAQIPEQLAQSPEQLDPKSETTESGELAEGVHHLAAESSIVSERDSDVAAEAFHHADTVSLEAKTTEEVPEERPSHLESAVSAPEAPSFEVDAGVSKTDDTIGPSSTAPSTDVSQQQQSVDNAVVTEELTTSLQPDVATPEESQVEAVKLDIFTRATVAVHEMPIAEETRLEASGDVSLPELPADATKDQDILETEATTIEPSVDTGDGLSTHAVPDLSLPSVEPADPSLIPESTLGESLQEAVTEVVEPYTAVTTAMESETTSEMYTLADRTAEDLEQSTTVLETIAESTQSTAPVTDTVSEVTEQTVEISEVPVESDRVLETVDETVAPIELTTSDITSAVAHITEPTEHTAESEEPIVGPLGGSVEIIEHTVESKGQILDSEGATAEEAQAADLSEDIADIERQDKTYEEIIAPATETADSETRAPMPEEVAAEPETLVIESDSQPEAEAPEESEDVAAKEDDGTASKEQVCEPGEQRASPGARVQEDTENLVEEGQAALDHELLVSEEQATEPEQVTTDSDAPGREPITQVAEPVTQVIESELQSTGAEAPITEPQEELEYVEEAAEREVIVDVQEVSTEHVEEEIVPESEAVEPEDVEHKDATAVDVTAVEPEEQALQLGEESHEGGIDLTESDIQPEAEAGNQQPEPIAAKAGEEAAPEEQFLEPREHPEDPEAKKDEAANDVPEEEPTVDDELAAASEEQIVEPGPGTMYPDGQDNDPITHIVEPVEQTTEPESQSAEAETSIIEPQEEPEYVKEVVQLEAIVPVQEESTEHTEAAPEIVQESRDPEPKDVEYEETVAAETVEVEEQAPESEEQEGQPGMQISEAGNDGFQSELQTSEAHETVQEPAEAPEDQVAESAEQVTIPAEQATVQPESDIFDEKEDVHQLEVPSTAHFESDDTPAEPVVVIEEDSAALDVQAIQAVTDVVEPTEPEVIDSETQAAEEEKPISELQKEPIENVEQVIEPTVTIDCQERTTEEGETATELEGIHDEQEPEEHVEQILEPAADISTESHTVKSDKGNLESEIVLIEPGEATVLQEVVTESEESTTVQQGVSTEGGEHAFDSEEVIVHDAVADEPEEETVDIDTVELDAEAVEPKEQAPVPAGETTEHKTQILEVKEDIQPVLQTAVPSEPALVADEQVVEPEEPVVESKEQSVVPEEQTDKANVQEEPTIVHHEPISLPEEEIVELEQKTTDPNAQPSEQVGYDSEPTEDATESESRSPDAEMPNTQPQEGTEHVEPDVGPEVESYLQEDTAKYAEAVVESEAALEAESNVESEILSVEPKTEAVDAPEPVTDPADRLAEIQGQVAELEMEVAATTEQSTELQTQTYEAEEGVVPPEAQVVEDHGLVDVFEEQAVDKEEETTSPDAQPNVPVGDVAGPTEQMIPSKTPALDEEQQQTAGPKEEVATECTEHLVTLRAVDGLEEETREHIEQITEPEMVVEPESVDHIQEATAYVEKGADPTDGVHGVTEHDAQTIEPERSAEPVAETVIEVHAEEPEECTAESEEHVSVPKVATVSDEQDAGPHEPTVEKQMVPTEDEEHDIEPEEDVAETEKQEVHYQENVMTEAEVVQPEEQAPESEVQTFKAEEEDMETKGNVPDIEASALEHGEPIVEQNENSAVPEAQVIEQHEPSPDSMEQAVDPESHSAEPETQVNEPEGLVVEPSEEAVVSEPQVAGADTLVADTLEATESLAHDAEPAVFESESDVLLESQAVESGRLVASVEQFVEPGGTGLSEEQDLELNQPGAELTKPIEPVDAVHEPEVVKGHTEQVSVPEDDIAKPEQVLVTPEEHESPIHEPDSQNVELLEEEVEREEQTFESETTAPVQVEKPEEEKLESEEQSSSPKRKEIEPEEQLVPTEKHLVQPLEAHEELGQSFIDDELVEHSEGHNERPVVTIDAPAVTIDDNVNVEEQPQDSTGNAFECLEHTEEPDETTDKQAEEGESTENLLEVSNEPVLDDQTMDEPDTTATSAASHSEEAESNFVPRAVETVQSEWQPPSTETSGIIASEAGDVQPDNVYQDTEPEVVDQEPIETQDVSVREELFEKALGQDITGENIVETLATSDVPEVVPEPPAQEPAETEASIRETEEEQLDENDVTNEEVVKSRPVASETVELENKKPDAEVATVQQGVPIVEEVVEEENRHVEIREERENIGDTLRHGAEPEEECLETVAEQLTLLQDEEHDTQSATLSNTLPLAELEAAEAEATKKSDFVVVNEVSDEQNVETTTDDHGTRVLFTDADTEPKMTVETSVNMAPSEGDIVEASPLESTAECTDTRVCSVAEIVETEPSSVEESNVAPAEDIVTDQGTEEMVHALDTVESEEVFDTSKTAMQAVGTPANTDHDVEGEKGDRKSVAVGAESDVPVYYGADVVVFGTSADGVKQTPSFEESNVAELENPVEEGDTMPPTGGETVLPESLPTKDVAETILDIQPSEVVVTDEVPIQSELAAQDD